MELPKELSAWDFPDTVGVPDGYDLKSVPEASRENFQKLVDEHNKLVEFVVAMAMGGA